MSKCEKTDALERIADALEWRNYFDWYNSRPDVAAFDDATGPPPPPPGPRQPPQPGEG